MVLTKGKLELYALQHSIQLCGKVSSADFLLKTNLFQLTSSRKLSLYLSFGDLKLRGRGDQPPQTSLTSFPFTSRRLSRRAVLSGLPPHLTSVFVFDTESRSLCLSSGGDAKSCLSKKREQIDANPMNPQNSDVESIRKSMIDSEARNPKPA